MRKMNDVTIMPFFGFLDSLFSSPFPKFYEREFESLNEDLRNANYGRYYQDPRTSNRTNKQSQNEQKGSYRFPRRNFESKDNDVYDA